MKREDERILEYLQQELLGFGKASRIAEEAFKMVSTAHVRERLEFLRYAGLVVRMWGSTYALTEDGRRYLKGDLDVSHQPTPTVDRVLRG
jgi:hypothetical protein